jgi:2'-5' RNA ligase
VPCFFVALLLPEEVKDGLARVQPPLMPGMRLIGRQELHLTLHFLGEVAAEQGDTVRDALAAVRANAFAIKINGLGQFPSEGPSGYSGRGWRTTLPCSPCIVPSAPPWPLRSASSRRTGIIRRM